MLSHIYTYYRPLHKVVPSSVPNATVWKKKKKGCHATYLSRIVHEAAVLHMADCTHCLPSQEESSSTILYTKIPMFVTFINSPTETKDLSLLLKKSPQKLRTTSLGS